LNFGFVGHNRSSSRTASASRVPRRLGTVWARFRRAKRQNKSHWRVFHRYFRRAELSFGGISPGQ
jgi:hypothetical protein